MPNLNLLVFITTMVKEGGGVLIFWEYLSRKASSHVVSRQCGEFIAAIAVENSVHVKS